MSNTKHNEAITDAAQVPQHVWDWVKAHGEEVEALPQKEYGSRQDHDVWYAPGSFTDAGTELAGRLAYEALVATGGTKKEVAYALHFQLPKDLTAAANRYAAANGLSGHKRQGGGVARPKAVTYTAEQILAIPGLSKAALKALAEALNPQPVEDTTEAA